MLPLSPWLKRIHHDGSAAFVSDLYPKVGADVTVTVRTSAEAPINAIYLRTFPDGEQAFAPLIAVTDALGNQLWRGMLPIRQPIEHYRFLIDSAEGLFWYNANGIASAEPLDAFDFGILADYRAPDWLHEAVFYQIFPDRFANGDPKLNLQGHEYVHDGQGPRTYAWHQDPDPAVQFPLNFYGGDLPGIIQNLDYLSDLGVNALFLNPSSPPTPTTNTTATTTTM